MISANSTLYPQKYDLPSSSLSSASCSSISSFSNRLISTPKMIWIPLTESLQIFSACCEAWSSCYASSAFLFSLVLTWSSSSSILFSSLTLFLVSSLGFLNFTPWAYMEASIMVLKFFISLIMRIFITFRTPSPIESSKFDTGSP